MPVCPGIFRFFLIGWFFLGPGLFMKVRAQSAPEGSEFLVQVSIASIEAEKSRIADSESISEYLKAQIIEIYDTALQRVTDGQSDSNKAELFEAQRNKVPENIRNLDQSIQTVRKNLARRGNDWLQEFYTLSLTELEQQLVAKRAQIESLRNTKVQYELSRQNWEQRSALARIELADAQQKIFELTTQLGTPPGDEQTPLERAGRILVQARLRALQQNTLMLEQEILSAPSQIDVLNKRLILTAVQILQADGVVQALQVATGSARKMNVEQQLNDATRVLENFAIRHEFVRVYAQENVNLVLKLGKIVDIKEDFSASEARIRTLTDEVIKDTQFTNQILSKEKVTRRYGEHLREIRQKQPALGAIRASINSRSGLLEDALFERIVNQEALDTFNTQAFDVEVVYQTYLGKVRENGEDELPKILNETDREALRNLYEYRREILSEIVSAAAFKATKLEELNALETTLLKNILSLCELLDARLLWLPSTESIDLNWPAKIVQGASQTFTPARWTNTWRAFTRGLISNIVFLVPVLVLIVFIRFARNQFASILGEMSRRVGRVQNDSYALTPIAIFDGVARAIPSAVLPFALALLLDGDLTDDGFVGALKRALYGLSILLIVFLTLRAWSRKGGLFDLHFRVDRQLRDRLVRYIPLFLTLQGISLVLVSLTQFSFSFDSAIATLGVLGFLIGAGSASYFAFKLAQNRLDTDEFSSRDTDGSYRRNEQLFLALAMVLPALTAIIALIGYYESARLLLWRLFFTFCALLVAYILHGLLRRTVVIAQRRLALEHARIRRDNAIKARSEKKAAEGRGEVAIPQLDYEQIDLATINRQSSQFVNIFVFIATAAALWALWSSLFPALSVFNDVELWGYDRVGPGGDLLLDANGQVVHTAITLWSVMQAIAISLITWLAARNLPGFLEIFILKRTRITQSSRFAIVTVLGYAIVIIGALIAFDKLGIQWSKLQWVIAALGLGIGFGLQEIIANFISGLIILFERPVRIGDYVTIGENSGTVTRIQIRATTLTDLDNKETLIPNKALVTERVTNWTLSNPVMRLIIDVGVAYGTDTAKARDVILEAVRKNPNVLKNPAPTALFLGFGNSSLDFEIRVFLRGVTQRFVVSHELHMAIDQALREAGIEIPFPQRDLHLKSDATKPKPKPGRKSSLRKS